ncbi:hypothetical protein HNQ59_000853 [Chitinivorax tropicus]|uniref:Uncharacterized protein n=1 Tax=Chitinivorax tropicus TaxID=714531 RepID=A0A840ME72_9PROT|nr:hypothetical protein [Chitinivorax tropicus]
MDAGVESILMRTWLHLVEGLRQPVHGVDSSTIAVGNLAGSICISLKIKRNIVLIKICAADGCWEVKPGKALMGYFSTKAVDGFVSSRDKPLSWLGKKALSKIWAVLCFAFCVQLAAGLSQGLMFRCGDVGVS